MSVELLAFLEDWLSWVQRGAPDGEPYDRDEGLCDSSRQWLLRHEIPGSFFDPSLLRGEMEPLWARQGLSILYPFGYVSFEDAEDNHTMHLDPNRIAWVTKTIAELKEEKTGD